MKIDLTYETAAAVVEKVPPSGFDGDAFQIWTFRYAF